MLDWVDTVWPADLKAQQRDDTNQTRTMKYPKASGWVSVLFSRWPPSVLGPNTLHLQNRGLMFRLRPILGAKVLPDERGGLLYGFPY